MPSVYACPGPDKKVMALACVPMILNSTRYQGIATIAEKISFQVFGRAAFVQSIHNNAKQALQTKYYPVGVAS